MRKVYNGFFALVLATLVLSSCRDEEDALPKKIVIDGEKLTLTHGYIQGFGPDQDDNNDLISGYGVVLTTGDLTIEDGSFNGSGSALLMQIISSSSIQLANGTYTIDVSESVLKNTAYSFVFYNFDETNGAEAQYNATEGTIVITKSGSNYRIKFNLVMETNEGDINVTGSFEGKLEETYLSIG